MYIRWFQVKRTVLRIFFNPNLFHRETPFLIVKSPIVWSNPPVAAVSRLIACRTSYDPAWVWREAGRRWRWFFKPLIERGSLVLEEIPMGWRQCNLFGSVHVTCLMCRTLQNLKLFPAAKLQLKVVRCSSLWGCGVWPHPSCRLPKSRTLQDFEKLQQQLVSDRVPQKAKQWSFGLKSPDKTGQMRKIAVIVLSSSIKYYRFPVYAVLHLQTWLKIGRRWMMYH